MKRFAFLLPLMALAACAGRGEQAASAETQAGLDRALAGLVPGQQTSCIPLTGLSVLSSRAYGKTLVYKASNGEAFRNDTGGGCENAARGDILVTVQYEGRPCAGDIIRTVDPYARTTTGSCALGPFIPYRKPPH
jgi:hypothetical protein